jgi:putative DNA primase/helicase
VARFCNGAAGKTFRQASRGDKGDWTATGMPKPRPLYRLPELLASHGTVYVVEGEKCADALAAIGVVAITSIGGASNAHYSDWKPLASRHVVIIPDADEQGAKYASDVAALMREAGAAKAHIVSMAAIWPEVPPKGDIADWIATRSHMPPELLREAVERRAADALLAPPSIIASGRTSGLPLEITHER